MKKKSCIRVNNSSFPVASFIQSGLIVQVQHKIENNRFEISVDMQYCY